MASGKVVALFLHPPEGAMIPRGELCAVEGQGLEGDRHFGRAKRQVLLLSIQDIEALGLTPGRLREQVTVDFHGLQSLPAGAILSVGEALLRIEGDCAPCAHMARELGEEPEAFIERSKGRRGMLAAVERSGRIALGDEVSRWDGRP